MLVAALAFPWTASPASVRMTDTEESFFRAVNAVRAQYALPAVRADAELQKAARAHTADMLARGYFAHGDFNRRLWRFGATGPEVGEDLGWSVDDGSATQRIVRMWLASSPHRAVLLRRGFTRIGLGVARGPFKGRSSCVVVTADFEGT